MKKLFTLFSAIILSCSASAFTVDNINYTVNGTNVTVSSHSLSESTDLVIPETVSDGVNEYTVTAIAPYAFNGCSYLTSVVIPNTVTSIGMFAFQNCANLASATISNQVQTIVNATFAETGLTSIVIPESVTSIGDWAFSNCKQMKRIYLPSSLTYIGEGGFGGNITLEYVECKNTTPPTLYTGYYNSFIDAPYTQCDLAVPEESKSLYQNAPIWKDFFQIITGIEAIEANAESAPVRYYDLRGIEVSGDELAPGLFIRRCGTSADKVLVK
ncbi:MAG: leucine-rich repeat domain-containing protein [Muribaculaceae bacterium]|nr:leucine-rich repeat domain-containing protein [Muribaculaceae bacterium]